MVLQIKLILYGDIVELVLQRDHFNWWIKHLLDPLKLKVTTMDI